MDQVLNWEYYNVLIFNYELKAYSGSCKNFFTWEKALFIEPEIQECFSSVLQRKTFLCPIEPLFPSSQPGLRGRWKVIATPCKAGEATAQKRIKRPKRFSRHG